MQFQGQGKPALGIVYDADMGAGIDCVLALAMLYGMEGKNEARVISISTDRPSLKAAAFCDSLAHFFGGPAGPFSPPISIGMTAGKEAGDPPVFDALAAKYPSSVKNWNDTADPVALMRNMLTSQFDGNAAVVLAGPPVNLLGLLQLPGAKELVEQKVKYLSVAEARLGNDSAAVKRLYSEWPTDIFVAPAALGDALPYPGESIEKDFAWSPAHPVADAYRAWRTMPYDAPSWAMTAALQAVRPKEKYFTAPEPVGRLRRLELDASQKERIIQAYTEMASAKPVPRQRFRKKQ